MLHRFKMGALEENCLGFLNFNFNVFVLLIYEKIPQLPLIVYRNEKKYFVILGLLRGTQLIEFSIFLFFLI